MIAFPEDYKTLVPKLLSETMMAIGSSFISRINLAIGDAVPETKALAKGCVGSCMVAGCIKMVLYIQFCFNFIFAAYHSDGAFHFVIIVALVVLFES